MKISKEAKIIISVLVIAGVLGGVLGVTTDYLLKRHMADNARSTELVQLVCDRAHAEINGASEEACGLAQEQTHTEYICDHFRNTPDVCWVEQK